MTNKRYVESSYKRLTEIKTMRNAVMNTWIHNYPIDWDDIEASIKYKMISRFGIFYTDTVIKLNVTQLVLN